MAKELKGYARKRKMGLVPVPKGRFPATYRNTVFDPVRGYYQIKVFREQPPHITQERGNRHRFVR